MTLSSTIPEFLDQLAVGKRPNTVDAYAVALCAFTRVIGDVDVATLTVDHVEQFGRALVNLRPATLNNYLAAVSRFYAFAFKRRWLEMDAHDRDRLASALHDMRRRIDPMPRAPDQADVRALIAAAEEPMITPPNAKPEMIERARVRRLRDIAIVRALESSGMRVGELAALTRGDLIATKRAATVTGKGDKKRMVYFNAATWDAIRAYISARRDGAGARLLGTLPLFSRHPGHHHISEEWVQDLFRRLSARAGLETPLTPHSMRHGFATRVLDATSDLAVVQDMLGHSSPVTTRIYAKVSSARMREAHAAAFGG